MENYLLEHHKDDITDLLNDDNDKTHISINIDLVILKEKKPTLYKAVITQVQKVSIDWNKALLEVQKKIVEDGNAFLEPEFQIKENCHVRFVNLPTSDNLFNNNFPSIDDIGLFVQVKGTITRVSQEHLLEFKREYICNKCKETFLIEAEYGRMYIFDVPKFCINSNGICRGTLQRKNSSPLPIFFMDFQVIRLQEMFSKKRHPLSLLICLENDLVDTCAPGECVTICGTIEYQRRPLIENKRGEVILTMHAFGIIKDEKKVNINKDFAEKMICVRGQWEDDCNNIGQLNARDLILQSICPEVYGMYPVKLALALSLCSGMEDDQSSGIIGSITKRGNSHILLIGDPGLAKSILLKSISKISLRAVHTTGLGCSSAGLTAAAIRDQGEWHLEAGALVLADGGVCCIDEFNLLQEQDKGALHEAMEQQTVSIAKAGMVSILNTRCVILAATNARCLNTVSDPEGLSALNIGIATPLLSRFDLIFILRDERNSDWDNRVAMHLLGEEEETPTIINRKSKFWNLEHLQSHFLAAHDIKPTLTTEAHLILSNYYKMCRLDSRGDPSRTTVRLLDSLNRLAQSHARLMLRSEVLGIDAIIVVRLMESTWGFGRLVTPFNVVKEELPLGPNTDDIHRVLNVLKLPNLEEKLLNQLKSFEKTNLTNNNVCKNNTENIIIENEVEKKRKCRNNIININDIELIFGFENQAKKAKISNKENKNNLNEKHSHIYKEFVSANLENNSEISSNLQNISTHSDILQPNNLQNKNISPEKVLIEWEDNDFDLSIELLEKSDNSQKNINKKAVNNILKKQENVPIIELDSIYKDHDLDDLDLELDSFLNKKQSESHAQVCAKNIKDSTNPIKTKENRNNLDLDKSDKTKSNMKTVKSNLGSIPGSKIIVNEKPKEISKKTIEKLNNFISPLQIDKKITSEYAESKDQVDSVNTIENLNSQSSICLLATQYDNLDFLEFD